MQTTAVQSLALGVALVHLIAGPAPGQGGPDPASPPHGGTLAAAGDRHFEVSFAADGLTLYPLTAEHRPADASGLSATATFFHPGASDRPWFARPLAPVPAGPGRAPTALALKLDLSQVPAQGVTVTFDVAGPGQPARFTVPFAPASGGALTVTKATQADQAAIAAQRTCPVSGEALGSMGAPVKVARGGRSVLLCCPGCLKTVRADPDRYPGRRPGVGTRRGTWPPARPLSSLPSN